MKEKFWSEYPVDLPDKTREMLWLAGRYGYSVDEISERMQVARSTVGDWLKRGRQKLADYLHGSQFH